MRIEVLAIALALTGCAPLCEYAVATAEYDIMLGLCVDRSDTRTDYEECKTIVKTEYQEKLDAID